MTYDLWTYVYIYIHTYTYILILRSRSYPTPKMNMKFVTGFLVFIIIILYLLVWYWARYQSKGAVPSGNFLIFITKKERQNNFKTKSLLVLTVNLSHSQKMNIWTLEQNFSSFCF